MIIGTRLPLAGERNRFSHASVSGRVSIRTERPVHTRIAKRTLDIAVSAVAAIVVVPLLVVLALAVGVTFRAWPFFVQNRVGKDGRSFRFIKLRTLPPTAPAYADKYSLVHLHIPRFAQFLRSTHLDEIPQVFLVLFGRMSLVGPRPEMEILHAQGDVHFANLRTNVRPGCAGLWQVGEHRGGLIWEAPEYDVLYLRNQSVRLDLWILWRTALYMTHIRPAVRFNEIPARFIKRPVDAPTHVAQPLDIRDLDVRDFDVAVSQKPSAATA